MIQPLISVIIPLYNKECWVKRSVESVLAQTYVHIEILIVNDGSTDKSLQIVESINDPRIKIFNKLNGGVSSARNMGIENAKGEYIAFLDADDEWKPKHLEVLLEGFESFEDTIVVCDDLVELRGNKSEREIEKRKLPFATNNENGVQYFEIKDYLQTLSDAYFILSGSSVLIKSSVVIEQQLYFYENLTHGEDVNYWIQLSKYGKFVFCDYLGVIYHHDDAQSAMNRKARKVQFVADYFHGLIWEDYNFDEQRKIYKFLNREYYKKAYQNRGLALCTKEFSGKIGEVHIGYFARLIYFLIRFCPTLVFSILKKIKSFKGK